MKTKEEGTFLPFNLTDCEICGLVQKVILRIQIGKCLGAKFP